MNYDTINIIGLKLSSKIGVHRWERQVAQNLVLDMSFKVDAAKISQSDDLADTIDYDALTRSIIDYVASQSVQLIETLAEGIAHHCFEHFNLTWMQLTLAKPMALADYGANVKITLERSRDRD